MILIDTSAWIEFLRDTGSKVCNTVDGLLGADLAICDAVSMEVLAGARDELHLTQLRGLLARATLVPIVAEDYDQAAALYRTCRRSGETVRNLIDCLIAAVAITRRLSRVADQDCANENGPLRVPEPGNCPRTPGLATFVGRRRSAHQRRPGTGHVFAHRGRSTRRGE